MAVGTLGALAAEVGTDVGTVAKLVARLRGEWLPWLGSTTPEDRVSPSMVRKVRAAFEGGPPALDEPFRYFQGVEPGAVLPRAASPAESVGWWVANGLGSAAARWHKNVDGRCADPNAGALEVGTVIGVGTFSLAKRRTGVNTARVCEACLAAAPPPPLVERKRAGEGAFGGPSRSRATRNSDRWVNY